jgi:hypothetical protein
MLRTLAIVTLSISLLSGATVSRADKIEEPHYTVVARLGADIEIRHYDAVVQAVVELPDSQHTNQGFRRLAGFIFGGNDTGQAIAMTAPVQETLFVDRPKMAFTMPSHLQLDDLPRPDDAGISIEPVAARTAAVIRFSGWATAGKIEKMTEKLKTTLQQNKVAVQGTPILAQYNPPWTLPFKRRNEVQLVVDWPAAEDGQKIAAKSSAHRQSKQQAY